MIHVAVAVIENDKGEVLISKRHDHLHQGGLWEYPGGKVEPDEDVQQALFREIEEELGVHIGSARPLIRIPHDYGDKQVLLDVWRTSRWSGEPHGREGQPLQWVARKQLHRYPFPAANTPITHAIQLPSSYAISPEPDDTGKFLGQLARLVAHGVGLVQLRAKSLSSDALAALAREAMAICHQHDATLLINGDIEIARDVGSGVHLTSSQLNSLHGRPLPTSQWVAASCHSEEEIRQAARLEVDFIVLSPVRQTTSHPGARPLGWDRFAALCEQAVMPVYALGGMSADDTERAQSRGGQGVAGITGFWPE